MLTRYILCKEDVFKRYRVKIRNKMCYRIELNGMDLLNQNQNKRVKKILKHCWLATHNNEVAIHTVLT